MPVDERCGGLTAVASRLERAHSREEIKVRLWFTSKLQMELCCCGDLWCCKNVTNILHRYVHSNASILHLLQRTHAHITPFDRPVHADVQKDGVPEAVAHGNLREQHARWDFGAHEKRLHEQREYAREF